MKTAAQLIIEWQALEEEVHQIVGMLGSNYRSAGYEKILHAPSKTHFSVRKVGADAYKIDYHAPGKMISVSTHARGAAKAADMIRSHMTVMAKRGD